MSSVDASYDVIVVGIGGVGSAALYYLARWGLDVLGIERYDVPHGMGSSHGGPRLFRVVHQEHPSYVPLARRAAEHWSTLEEEAERTIFRRTGSLHPGDPDGDYVERIRESADKHDLDLRTYDAATVGERFPAYDLPEDHVALFQPDGGFLVPEQCIAAHVERAHNHNATVHGRERVLHWEDTGKDIQLETDKGTYRADRVVVTVGSWTGKMFPDIGKWIVPERRVIAWFQPHDPHHFEPANFPPFRTGDERTAVYGFPTHDRPGFKIGRVPPMPDVVDPDELQREPTRQEEDLLRREVERYFPTGAGPTLSLRTCMITRSRDEHFLVGRHPDHSRVALGAGFTGHGFMLASAIGEILADVTVDGSSPHLPELFSVDRIRASSSGDG